MADDTYEPYEPPAAPDAEPAAPESRERPASAAPEHQWPLLGDDVDRVSAPAPPPVYVQNPYRTPPPARPATRGGPIAAVAAIVALAVGVGSYASSQSEEPDYREQWEQCLAEQDTEGLLEPEDLCSIQFPDAEEEYGDLGYDNEELDPFLDEPNGDPDWYIEE